MLINYASLQNKPRILQSLTGLSLDAFKRLVKPFGEAWDAYVQETWVEGKTRARAYGGGRPVRIDRIEDKLLFILFYFRQYPTQEVQGYLFGLGQPQANIWIHRLSPILNQALGAEQHLPERNPSRLSEVLQACPSLEFMIDGVERPVNRSKDKHQQQDQYSGKKKRHTFKNVVITSRKRKIEYLSDTYGGRVHDKSVADGEGYEFPEGSDLWQDSGFQGFAPKGAKVRQPKKCPRKGALTPEETAENQAISKVRVDVEHQIGGAKRCNIVSHPFRNRKDYYADDVMETACGLHNFRQSLRQAEKEAAA